jgi:hypothetical protein
MHSERFFPPQRAQNRRALGAPASPALQSHSGAEPPTRAQNDNALPGGAGATFTSKKSSDSAAFSLGTGVMIGNCWPTYISYDDNDDESHYNCIDTASRVLCICPIASAFGFTHSYPCVMGPSGVEICKRSSESDCRFFFARAGSGQFGHQRLPSHKRGRTRPTAGRRPAGRQPVSYCKASAAIYSA